MRVSYTQKFRLGLERNGTGLFRIVLNRILPAKWKLKKLLIYSQCAYRSNAVWPFRHRPLDIAIISSTMDQLFPELISAFPDQGFDRRLLKVGTECYIAIIENGVVGYAWTVENEFYIGEINYRYRLRKAEYFIYDCFVKPEHRGNGIYPALLRAILQDKELRRPDLRLAYIGVASENRSSRRGIVKAGFDAVSSIRYMRLGGMEKWWCRKT